MLTHPFKYYLKQKGINKVRNDFINKIAGRRLRLILFAASIEILGVTFLILLGLGYQWAAGGSILILGAALQGKLLLLFIDDDLDITFINNTLCTSEG